MGSKEWGGGWEEGKAEKGGTWQQSDVHQAPPILRLALVVPTSPWVGKSHGGGGGAEKNIPWPTLALSSPAANCIAVIFDNVLLIASFTRLFLIRHLESLRLINLCL